MRLERAVEIVEHDAGLDRAAPVADVELDDPVEMLRAVDDQRRVHRLPALRGAAAARQHADTPSSRAIAIARSASAIVRGATTPSGIIW